MPMNDGFHSLTRIVDVFDLYIDIIRGGIDNEEGIQSCI